MTKVGYLIFLIVLLAVAVICLVKLPNPSDVLQGHKDWVSSLDNCFLEVGVPKEELDSCYRWSFGDDVAQIKTMFWDDRWRERHSDLFVVEGHDPLHESLRKIGKAYLEQKEWMKTKK